MSAEILKDIKAIIEETNGKCDELGKRFDKSLRWKIVAARGGEPKEEYITPGVNAIRAQGYQKIKEVIQSAGEPSSQK